MKDTRPFLTAGFRSRVTSSTASSDNYAYRARLYEFRLHEIGRTVAKHHLTWCSDEYPMIEILDWEGRNTLAFFKFTTFEDLDKRLEELSK
jgi:hypothetical protein